MSLSIPGTPVIDLRGVSVGYDDRPTVTGVDLRIDPGEVVALVGPNGSGKTTLVRGLLGLARIMSGEARLFGVPIDRFGERYRIGYVPQRHTVGGAIPSTVEEVVMSGRLPRKRRPGRLRAADRAAVAAAIEAVGLTERRKAAVSTLSGGQQRRALIARALAAEPDVLVMDEPTAGVDAENQERLVETLSGLVGRGLTLLIVTHEITPLRPILTRVVALEAGRIVRDVAADGSARKTVELPDPEAGHDSAHCTPEPVGRGAGRGPLPAWGWLGFARLRGQDRPTDEV